MASKTGQFGTIGEQATDVREVQAGGRLVYGVDTVDAAPLVKFAGKFDALALAAGEDAQALAKGQVVQANIAQRLEFGAHICKDEGLQCSAHGHAQHFGNGLPGQHLALEALAATDFAPDC